MSSSARRLKNVERLKRKKASSINIRHNYGQLLILNAGGGYHVLLAGMERISVDLGQFVLTGEPVAVMGGGPQSAAAIATGSRQPVLYIEFRKDGTPVDPSPWWAITNSEKVRG